MNVSEENLAIMTCAILMNTEMKDTLKKVFFDISSTEHKTVPAIKEEVKTVNFSWYQSSREQKTYRGNKTNPIDRKSSYCTVSNVILVSILAKTVVVFVLNMILTLSWIQTRYT